MKSDREGSGKFSADNIKEVQQALKDKGHDPGSIDGIMGQQTQQALRSFQQQEGLKATGTLDDKTAQKLGVSVAPRGGTSSGDLKPGRSEMPSSVEEQRDQKKDAD
ncbi:MAG: peptidoglycan-binding domain-containing protein [Candidatus Binatia bacterium]